MSTTAETIEQGFDRDAKPRTDMVSPLNTELSEQTQELPTRLQDQPIPTGVSPLVSMLATGQLKAEHVDTAMELQRKHDQYEAEKLFNVAIAKFRSQVQNVINDRMGHNNGSYYATLGSVTKTIAKPCADNGLSHYWTNSQENGKITVVCHLTHSAGHSISTSLTSNPETSGNKNDIQAIGSAISYLKRYTLLGLLGLATEDDDGQAAAPSMPPPKLITEKQESELVDLLDAGDALDPNFSKRAMSFFKTQYKESDTPFGLVVAASDFNKVRNKIKTSLDQEKAKQEKDADK